MFEIIRKDPSSKARLGRLNTAHGVVETPSYVIVGTNAVVRCLQPEDLPTTKTQMIIANTYHLWRSLGDEGLESFQGLHSELGFNGPVMTDSGGFQVFSMGASREHGVGKKEGLSKRVGKNGATKNAEDIKINEEENSKNLVRVTESGVYFMDEGEEQYLDAEISMKIQEQLGADIIFAFDEPSSPLHDYAYTKESVERTHRWAERSLEAKVSNQKLYGIVQGGAFEDLRKESAKHIGAMPFDGFGIGGAFGSSYGSAEEDSIKELSWIIPYLPEHKPRHFLGMGKVGDIFYGVEAGIDTFDCVIPTREARHGGIWTESGRLDILKGKNSASEDLLDEACGCPTCAEHEITKRDLHGLFKDKNPEAGRYATMHNVYFFNNLMENIRLALREGKYAEFKNSFMKKFKNS